MNFDVNILPESKVQGKYRLFVFKTWLYDWYSNTRNSKQNYYFVMFSLDF